MQLDKITFSGLKEHLGPVIENKLHELRDPTPSVRNSVISRNRAAVRTNRWAAAISRTGGSARQTMHSLITYDR